MGERHAALLVDLRWHAHRHGRLPPHVLPRDRRRDRRHLVLVRVCAAPARTTSPSPTSSCPPAVRSRSSERARASTVRCTCSRCSRCSRSRSRRCASGWRRRAIDEVVELAGGEDAGLLHEAARTLAADAGRHRQGRGRARVGAGVPARRGRQDLGGRARRARRHDRAASAHPARGDERRRALRRGRRPRCTTPVAVRRSSRPALLQRCFRDIHTATQHIMVQPRGYEGFGKLRLGLPTDTAML